MMKQMRTVLLLALALGLCLNSSAMAMRVCVLTLDTCCEHSAAPDCSTECCGSGASGCCLVVLSDEAAMLVPSVEAAVILSSVDLRFHVDDLLPPEPTIELSADSPDPPPLPARERLSRLNVRLI